MAQLSEVFGNMNQDLLRKSKEAHRQNKENFSKLRKHAQAISDQKKRRERFSAANSSRPINLDRIRCRETDPNCRFAYTLLIGVILLIPFIWIGSIGVRAHFGSKMKH